MGRRPFQSTLPIREETKEIRTRSGHWHFNPLFPYGKRLNGSVSPEMPEHFNPLFPYGKRRAAGRTGPRSPGISIHSSHTGRDSHQVRQSVHRRISIHSSHTGRDPIRSRKRSAGQISIHSSHTGRDPHNDDDRPNDGISIHSSHTGRDLGVQVVGGLGTDFNPLFPYGKRRGEAMTVIDLSRFQSTLPIREETNSTTSTAWGWEDFNPLFPYGKRPRGQHPNSLANLFQSTLPIREETALGVIRRWMEEFQSTLPIREET